MTIFALFCNLLDATSLMTEMQVGVAFIQMGDVMASWIVISTHPHKELFAQKDLRQKKFDVYCPMMLKRIKHARYTQDVSRPLFPGYLFVRTSPEFYQWRPVLSTLGVRSIVKCGNHPSSLDDRFIAALKMREADGLIVQSGPQYSVGQQVQFSEGPFDGIVATIIEISEKDRIVVLLDLLQRQVNVKVDVKSVSPV